MKQEQSKPRVIMMADCQSFYASVEKAAHPEYENRPVVVAADPEFHSGIILAACPIAKQWGITTAERLGEALRRCPELVVVRPRMQEYIDVSLQITKILESFTDLVEPYSIDEQFVDVTGSLRLFGTPLDIAKAMQERIRVETGVYTRIGISENKVLAKMACDNVAKKHPTGLCLMPKTEMERMLWPLPVNKMFMVGSRMTRHLNRMGIYTIGQLAVTPIEKLRKKWGVNGEVLWRIANGIDDSPVDPYTHRQMENIGHNMTLPREYAAWDEIKVVLLELTELACRRCREHGVMGNTVSVGCSGSISGRSSGFHRQMKLPDPTYVTEEVFEAACRLFRKHWDGEPIRRIGVSLDGLTSDQQYQLTLFDNRVQKMALARVTDGIKQKYGDASIMRASSATKAGQAQDRARKIGGHYK
ncbi:DNA polymerase IV [Paenibacillus hamazuiensis]|uniref:DNA polymerase IV n=1 Tax=Paenibacillus hamazuiensis TaxID=2936508 RepID=UPI00200EE978|nr:DNA polymerase IV [Paenibacillus hamazuiensis]